MLSRSQKEAMVEELKEKFSKANGAFVTHYRGLTVDSVNQLRSALYKNSGELKVVKNRIAKIAAKGSPFEGLSENFRGPVAVAFSYEDPVGVAKAVLDQVSDDSPYEVKVGTLDGKDLSFDDIKALSSLPDKETLLQMTVSVLQAPIRNFACVMAAVPRDFVNVISAVKKEKENAA